jgi:hypothetical protein
MGGSRWYYLPRYTGISDGASIPWYVRWLLKKGGPLFTPSVIHDIGYGRGLMIRKKVDDIFMEAMILNKVERWKRYLIYKAVRLRGASRYNNNRG